MRKWSIVGHITYSRRVSRLSSGKGNREFNMKPLGRRYLGKLPKIVSLCPGKASHG
ncbi:unnamed protein product [Ectocarpus sp. 12 AP-2014]